MSKILVVGATGLVGRLVVEQALADPRVTRVVALTRRPIAANGKLQNVVAQFSSLPEHADWWAVDGVVSALGTTRADTPSAAAYRAIDHDYPIAVARLARKAGATRFAVVSSIGANPRSRFAYTRLKGELEVTLNTLGYASLTIVQPSMLSGPRERQRDGERLAISVFRLVGTLLPQRLRVSPAETVATALLNSAIAAEPGLHVLTNAMMS